MEAAARIQRSAPSVAARHHCPQDQCLASLAALAIGELDQKNAGQTYESYQPNLAPPPFGEDAAAVLAGKPEADVTDHDSDAPSIAERYWSARMVTPPDGS